MTNLCKILVVDDEPLLKLLISQKFKAQMNSKEMEFLFANNGIEALEHVKQNEDIGVILTDIKMPLMDGLTLIQELNKEDRFYKIIVASAYGDMSNIRKAMEAGACDFILKPFDMKDFEISLMNAVHQYLELKLGLQAKDQMIKLAKEIELAKEIKKAFIPSDFSVFKENRSVRFAGEMMASHNVGGDFFDFFPLDDHTLGIVAVNLTSKGIPAAFHTAMIQMLARAVGVCSQNPSECVQQIHKFLIQEIPSHIITGLFYGIFNTRTGELNYSSTGDVIPYILVYKEHIVKVLKDDHQVKLQSKDKFFITTKQLTSSRNKEGEDYTENRLKNHLIEGFELSCQQLINKIREDVILFTNAHEQEQDAPLFCLELV